MLVCVDGGTTNTRLTLIENGNIPASVKIPIGAGNQKTDDSVNPYLTPLRHGLRELLQQHGLTENDVDALVFSGMICSETGLHTVPHIAAPADAEKTARAMECISIPEITDRPMYFVPGIRTEGKSLSDTDIMRGEETELFGICRQMDLGNFVAVMPGSHTKITRIGTGGTILSFRTAMTGELIRAAAEHTILRTVLYGVFPKTPDKNSLEEGYDYCAEYDVSSSLFHVRILQKFSDKTPQQLFAFLCGVCLHGDIRAILKEADGMPIYVGGSDPFRSAYVHLLCREGNDSVHEIPEAIAEHAAAYGAELLLECRNRGV